jgi:hypothetical protein
MRRPTWPKARTALLAIALAFGVAGCENLDSWHEFEFFGTKKKPIQGDRHAVFPEGVPGVQYNAPPSQPTNSNVPIDVPASAPTAQAPTTGPAATPPARTAARTKDRPGDPWNGAR